MDPKRMRRGGVVLIAVFLLAMTVNSAAAQEAILRVDGRVLWVAGHTMVVASFASGTGSVTIDLSQADQDEYMGLMSGDPVSVLGMVAPGGDRLVATSIRRP